MKKKTVYLMEEEWDHLIILDACRYDYFRDLYSDYLEGKLERVRSPSFHTEKWRKEVFTEEHDDVVYVSANPYINGRAEIKGFSAQDLFHDVIDVWGWGWDDELGTVPPGKVNEGVREARRKYPDKRLIIHYLQPHAPYLSLGKLPGKDSFGEVRRDLGSSNTLGDFLTAIRDTLGKKFVKIFSWELGWKVNRFLGFPPAIPEESAFRKVGKEGMRKAYRENLEIVLKSVEEIIEELNGKIIVTADHGELLGEGGDFVHHDENHPLLREVPWLRIERNS
ncbi:hypothetical protein AKJ65_03895 [candidate division MSBL1 archaeon SCGC-AAA259E19]|uniref:Sulfatase N-terminal domain-containing protein n=1 Tax=candidate division MSBL1 archaeon SCGC-AAA259E19 TaxID=1698264 RepID=A0A133UKG1_9EURY|nr:hypothetical protein AKJ65_03895 [candidate division MSBL1 archaeon SCGC-AAA259E19]